MRLGPFTALTLVTLGAAALLAAACRSPEPPDPPSASAIESGYRKWAEPQLESLADLSLAALRKRSYGSTIGPELNLDDSGDGSAYHAEFSADGSLPYDSYVASYESDGHRVYARVDLPARPAPPNGYPVLIFIHGWVGREAAPDFDFMYRPDSLYSRYIDAFVDDGFVVISPALRGHGTVGGIPAEGIEFLDAWDNASYLSPLFYTIDTLNLLEGIHTLEAADWAAWGHPDPVRIDSSRVSIAGHSQGGDVVLSALAVSGDGSTIRNTVFAGSIWSGCFGPRLEQAGIYGPMAATPEAFLSGDGSWTSTAIGRDGRTNPNFIFGWPPDWIVTPDPASPEWSWQASNWSAPTVAGVLQERHDEMYRVINSQVDAMGDAAFELVTAPGGRVTVRHDPRIADAMQAIDAYSHVEWLKEPLHLHHSDQDYYSVSRWNADLVLRVGAAGGQAADFVYPRNTHSLLASPHHWFSPGETVAGLPYMIRRDRVLFSAGTPGDVLRQADEPLSIEALRIYASALKNEFEPEYDREPLGSLSRRVVSFHADGLKQFALVTVPAGQPPTGGWPVLLVNHGHHPNPPDYGRIADGSTDRPGDYYRRVPEAFARQGFLVVTPDFRGHNDSEGAEYTHGLLESYWYTRDAIAAFRALGSLPSADLSNVFLWGHSMGGNVTLRALLALGDEVRGASIWSSSSAGAWEKADNYASRANADNQPVDDYRESLGAEINALPFDFDPAKADPTGFIEQLVTPLNIHHAKGDPVTPFRWSESIAAGLAELGHPSTLHAYPSSDHFFADPEFSQAVARDAAFFRRLMR